MSQSTVVEQHSFSRSLILHLLPGVLTGICYFLLLGTFQKLGYPSFMVLMVAVAITLVPFELIFLFYQGYKKNGRLSLEGIVCYRESIPVGQYFIWVPVIFVLAGFIFTLMKPVDAFVQQNFFTWVPVMESGLTIGFSRSTLIVTYLMVAIFGVVIGPTVEEYYFRGYLLPRMNYAGKWAPLLHTFLFALYHVFTPWMFVTRTLSMLPLVYGVMKRNLSIGIFAHILLNIVDLVAGVAFILAMSST